MRNTRTPLSLRSLNLCDNLRKPLSLEDRLSKKDLTSLIKILLALMAMEMDDPEEELVPKDYASA